MEVQIKSLENKDSGKAKLAPEVFGEKERKDILHRVVTWQMAKARGGNHKTKERSEVTGSTRKIYKQKGMGRARHGSNKANIFVGGGICFGPRVRSHEFSLNKKVRNLGLRVALSLKHKEKSIIVLDAAKLKSAKTSDLSKKLKGFEAKSALIVDSQIDENLKLSSANLPGIDVLPAVGLNVVDILKHDKIMLTVDALKQIEERLK